MFKVFFAAPQQRFVIMRKVCSIQPFSAKNGNFLIENRKINCVQSNKMSESESSVCLMFRILSRGGHGRISIFGQEAIITRRQHGASSDR